jgi:chemotaxis protein MotA
MIDFTTIIGLIAGLGAILLIMTKGGLTSLLFNPWAAILVFGGTIASILITYPFHILKRAVKAIKVVFLTPHKEDPTAIIETLVSLAEKSKAEGIASLQDEIANLNDNFMRTSIQMVVDSVDPDLIRSSLENEVLFIRKRHREISNLFYIMGAYAPMFGLLGTLIGVVQVLRNITAPSTMASSLAIAVTTTMYGIICSNFIFTPIAGKLKSNSEYEILLKYMVIEGVMSIHQGDIPLIVRKKLESYVAERLREK